jgi:predicted patatin/cPLA2 family phospholipase
MAVKSLEELAEKMRDIDFAVLSTRTENEAIAAKPMSNNREVEFIVSLMRRLEQLRTSAAIPGWGSRTRPSRDCLGCALSF